MSGLGVGFHGEIVRDFCPNTYICSVCMYMYGCLFMSVCIYVYIYNCMYECVHLVTFAPSTTPTSST